MESKFTPGKQLCKQFYFSAVAPILHNRFPTLKYSAGLMGDGSEVLGFDDAVSTDHHWGPRVQLFLSEADLGFAEEINSCLSLELPYEFMGYSTNFSDPDPNDSGVQHLVSIDSGRINHRVTVETFRGFIQNQLGFDINFPIETSDWLSFSEQRLKTIAEGEVFVDGADIAQLLRKFAYYPRDVWFYLMASAWARIGQEEHLMGRAGSVGDEVGSALIGARLVRDVMRLCFYQEKIYASYPKWFGTAFKRLSCGTYLYPILEQALHSTSWQEREIHLVKAYEYLAEQHNRLKITKPMPEKTHPFFGRPFQVLAIDGFCDALIEKIEDPTICKIAQRPIIGGIDLLSDNTDLVSNPYWYPRLKSFFD